MKLKIVTIICLHLDRRAKCVSMKVRCCLSPEDWRRLHTVGPLPAAGDTRRWPQITTKIIIISMSSSAAAPLLSYFDDPEN